MSHIHITLVGGQPAPVYQGIIETNPDRVILIHSEQTKEDAIRIDNEIEIETRLIQVDPVDINLFDFEIETIKKDLGEYKQLSINLGGGTKVWSILFYKHFINDEKAELFYIDQNGMYRSFKEQGSKLISFDMDTQFRLYGTVPKDYHTFDIYTEEDKQTVSTIKKLRRFNYSEFNYLSKEFDKSDNRKPVYSNKDSSIEWNKEGKKLYITITNNKGDEIHEVLDSPNALQLFTNTGWFEYEVARILNEWNKSKEIRLNCIFPTQARSPKNEIDIIINTGNKLLFVECKTQIFNETDIDKFAAAVKNYGGMSSKAIFITDAKMRDKAIEKCNDNNIMHFSFQNYGGSVLAKKSLYDLLDKELLNINSK